MNQRDYFLVGTRLIGLCSILLALFAFLPGLAIVIRVIFDSTAVSEQYGFQLILLFALPTLLAGFGGYLLKGRAFIHWIVFEESHSTPSSKMPEYFTLGAKLYGAFLVVATIPTLVQRLAHFLFALNELVPLPLFKIEWVR